MDKKVSFVYPPFAAELFFVKTWENFFHSKQSADILLFNKLLVLHNSNVCLYPILRQILCKISFGRVSIVSYVDVLEH